jgi:hypothetical protein
MWVHRAANSLGAQLTSTWKNSPNLRQLLLSVKFHILLSRILLALLVLRLVKNTDPRHGNCRMLMHTAGGFLSSQLLIICFGEIFDTAFGSGGDECEDTVKRARLYAGLLLRLGLLILFLIYSLNRC